MQKKKIIFISLFFILIIILASFFMASFESKKYYKQGQNFEDKKDYQNAYYNFSKINFLSSIYIQSIFKQAKCAEKAGDKKTTYKKFHKLSIKTKDEYLLPYSNFEVANYYLENKKEEKALKLYKKIQKKFPKSDFSYASNYKIGEILLSKNIDEAKKYYIEYLKIAPLGRYSKSAIQNIENSKMSLTEDDKLILAISLYDNEYYDKSLFYLNQISFDKSYYYLIKNYIKKDKNMALNLSFRALTTLDIKDKETLEAIVDFYTLNKNLDEEKILFDKVQTYNNFQQNYIMLCYAKKIPIQYAYKVWEKIYLKNNDYSPYALSEMIFYNYKIKNYKNSITLGQKYLEKYKNKQTTPYAMFYVAKSYKAQKQDKLAFNMFQKIINEYPNNYYALRSKMILGKNEKFEINDKEFLPKNFSIEFPENDNKILNTFAKLNDIQALSELKIKNDFIQSYIAYKQQRYSYSLLLARDGAQKKNKLTNEELKLVYPIYFEDEISKNASYFKISPYIIISIIKKESSFNKNAKSDAGAIGLMQILPDTAQFIESKNYKANKLKDIDYNIYLGTKYFNYLKKQFNNSDLLAVIAYNAGPGKVHKWLQESDTSDIDVFIETIPYMETKTYVKRVFENYLNYRQYNKI